MKNFIKYILAASLILFLVIPLWGQYKPLEKPPKHENTYLFKILKYNRQPHIPNYIDNRLSQILQNSKADWTPQDSLYFAYKNVYLQNYSLALSVFSQLNTDTITEAHAQTLYRTTLQHLGRFEDLKQYNKRTFKDDTSSIYSPKKAFMELIDAYIAFKENGHIPDSTEIFPILHQKETLKNLNIKAPPYKNKFVKIAFAVDSAFRQFTFLHDGKDLVLSKAFEEMGDFQNKYLYLTNAYFYYAGALHYNKTNKFLINKYNRSIDEMTANNYLSISFKHKFGRILKNRYDLKENTIDTTEVDNLPRDRDVDPPVKKEKKDYLPMLDTPILILIILAAGLLFVLFFVRTKK